MLCGRLFRVHTSLRRVMSQCWRQIASWQWKQYFRWSQRFVLYEIIVCFNEWFFIKEDYLNDTHLSTRNPRRRSSSTSEAAHMRLEFEVSDFFLFGSPLALVLAYRRLSAQDDKSGTFPTLSEFNKVWTAKCKGFISRPFCHQVYNMFHPTDPVASRLEPLISARFSILPPMNVPRYAKYPLGNGQSYHLRKFFYKVSAWFNYGMF